jgi:hypothetical protein
MLDKPKSISLCFIGSNDSVDEQILAIKDLEEEFEVEIWKRSERYPGIYHSYSQIINEAVCDTTNEFMFFINPKVSNITVHDIYSMLHDLLNGFCWSSRIAFGLFGTTKELFRRVGLMDERFIGSEYEDDDFSLRLKIFNKAIIWKYDYSRYPDHPKGSPLPNMRGASASIFQQKWNRLETNEDVYLLDKKYANEKNLPTRIKLEYRDDIYKSWLDYSKSEIQENSHVGIRGKFAHIFLDERGEEIIRCDSKILITSQQRGLRVELLCPVETKIFVIATKAIDGEERTVTARKEIKSNTWNLGFLEEEGPYEIKIFHEGEKIYHNKKYYEESEILLEIGLRITKKIGDFSTSKRISPNPRIRLVHLLLDPKEPQDIPEDLWNSRMEKQKKSQDLFSKLDSKIDYFPLFTKLNRTEIPRESCADPDIINYSKELVNNPPVLSYGHYGAYVAHRTAIMEYFDGDLDGLIVLEGDVVFDCTEKEIADWFFKALDFSLLNDGSLVTFGKVSFGTASEASIRDTRIPMGDFTKIDHFLCAHCYMITKKEREQIQSKLLNTGWHAWDIWLYWNYDKRVPIYSSIIPLVREPDGMSMIDYTKKEN